MISLFNKFINNKYLILSLTILLGLSYIFVYNKSYDLGEFHGEQTGFSKGYKQGIVDTKTKLDAQIKNLEISNLKLNESIESYRNKMSIKIQDNLKNNKELINVKINDPINCNIDQYWLHIYNSTLSTDTTN